MKSLLHRSGYVFSLISVIGLSAVLSGCTGTKEPVPQKEIDAAKEALRVAEKSGAHLFVPDKWKTLSGKDLDLREELNAQQDKSSPSYKRTKEIADDLKSFAESVREKAIEQFKNALLASESFILVPNTRKLVLYQYELRSAGDLIGEHPEIQGFIKQGLVAIQPYKVILGRPFGSKVTLTETGENERQSTGWKEEKEEQYPAFQVVLAKKELVGDPSEPTISGNMGECTIRWKWSPNKIGKAFGVSSEEKTTRLKIFLENGRVVFEPIS